MRFETQSFRAVHLALDRLQMDNSSYGGCPSGYINPLKGGLYITPLDIPPPLAPPTPSLNNTFRGRGVQGRRPCALTRLPDRRTTIRLGRGVWGAPRNTQRIFGKGRACAYLYKPACVFVQHAAGLSCRVSGCRAVCPPEDGSAQFQPGVSEV